jgi:hypothetical protein
MELFYENFDMNFDVKGILYSCMMRQVPVHSYFTITIEDDKYGGSRENVYC